MDLDEEIEGFIPDEIVEQNKMKLALMVKNDLTKEKARITGLVQSNSI